MKFGFKNVDAMEPSTGMLNKLKEKNIYKNIFFEGIQSEKISSIAQDSYDATITCGTIGEGYLPIESINEFLRITNRGGYVIISMVL